MHVVVCLKQILDPEIPARDFRIDHERREAAAGSARLVTNVFCENALETALQFRERAGGRITAVSMGPDLVEEVLRRALALKADAAVHVAADAAPCRDPLAVARGLAAAVRRLDAVDLVLVGRESGDWGFGQSGALVAELLEWPCLAFVDELSLDDGKLRLRRQTESGWERFEAAGPIVATVTNSDHNQPRIAKTRDVMMSHRQPITRWTLAELGVADDEPPWCEVIELQSPIKESRCEMISGDTLDERIATLAERIDGALRAG